MILVLMRPTRCHHVLKVTRRSHKTLLSVLLLASPCVGAYICGSFFKHSNCHLNKSFLIPNNYSIKSIQKYHSNHIMRMNKITCVLIVLLGVFINKGASLYCYRCNSNQPGCGTPLNWLWYWGETCPEYDDKCVKIIERKGAETMITRECLSSVRSFRTDIPADRYEGCRPASKDVRLGHYVNNSIWQLDIHRDYYDEVTWCFCYFDHRCNSAASTGISILLFVTVAICYFSL